MLRTIRCIGISEEEMVAAEKILKSRIHYERKGFNITSLAEESDILALEKLGLIVEVVPKEANIGWLEPDKTVYAPELMADSAPNSPLSNFRRDAGQFFVIQFDGNVTSSQRYEIASKGVQLSRYVPDFAYKAALTPVQKEALEGFPYIRRIVHYSPALTLRRVAPIDAAAIRDKHGATSLWAGFHEEHDEIMYNILCHRSEDLNVVESALRKDARITRVERGRNRIRIATTAEHTRSLLIELAHAPAISVIEPFRYPSPLLEFVRQSLSLEPPAASVAAPGLPWRGEGQLVAVADSGIDSQHPDLKFRLKKLIERVLPEAPDDPYGHGTHVCSIVAGEGNVSNGRLQGIAPGVELIVQSIRDNQGRFIIPVDMAELFQEAYNEGARIHNNSWGSPSGGLYTTDALELDQFVHEHPDFLIVIAAGNEGQQPNPLTPDDPLGRVGLGSIASPATSKNSITVGACCSVRLDGPYRGMTWKQYRGRLPSPQWPPLADQRISGDHTLVAAFSSRGPTDDSRLKPDLVVPATVVLAACSAQSTPNFPEPDFDSCYAYESGTSMAAPVVAGAAAIVRQYYIKERSHLIPSAALLKATLINGCEWIVNQLSEDDRIGQPNFHQGFGRLNMALTLPVPGNTDQFGLSFIDIANDGPDALDSIDTRNAAWRRRIQVDGQLSLSLTLCWTDAPGHGLQNHLDLMVHGPSGTKIVGNSALKRDFWAKTDRFNNVERIRIDTPNSGIWTIVVQAVNTPSSKQGFSLVATGKLMTDFF